MGHTDVRAVRPAIRVIPLACLIVLSAALPVLAAVPPSDFVWVEAWRHTSHHPVAQAAASWPPGGGPALFATVGGGRVTLYFLEPEGPRFAAAIDDLPEAPSAVHVRAGGAGVDEVWVGTAPPGIVYRYRFDRTAARLELLHRIRFAWGRIVQVLPFDLDGWGELDVAVRTDAGGLALFRWTEQGYREVPLGAPWRDVRALSVGRLQPDARERLVVARGADHVLVLDWELSAAALAARREREAFEEMMRAWESLPLDHLPGAAVTSPPTGDGGEGRIAVLWENYVWGAHLGLFVAPFAGGATDQIAVLTSQNLLYLFGYDADRAAIGPIRPPVTWPEPQAILIGAGALDRSLQGGILQATASGLASWRVEPSPRVVRTLDTSVRPVSAVFAGPGEVVVYGSQGFALLAARPPDYVRVLRRGREISLEHAVLVRDDTLYLSAPDWRRLAGLSLRWPQPGGRITGLRGFHFFAGAVGEREWIVDGRPVELDRAPLVEAGMLYLPVSFGRALGVAVEWEPYSHTLVVE